jgi:hypothetical protein
MGEATDRPKTAYAAGVVLGFKNLQLFIQDGTKGGDQIKQMDPDRAFQLFHAG